MRHAGNFNPEWGYLAPAPGFLRTVRIALVAAAVGASAGGAVVFSLIERPVAETSVAARTLVQPSGSVPDLITAKAPEPTAQPGQLTQPLVRAASAAAAESSKSSTAQAPASIAALAEMPAAADAPPPSAANGTAQAPDASAQKKVAKKQHYTARSASRSEQMYGAGGPLALLPPSRYSVTLGANPLRREYSRGEYSWGED
jgi:hypothetical protein